MITRRGACLMLLLAACGGGASVVTPPPPPPLAPPPVATQLAVSTTPSTSVVSGNALAVQPAVQLKDTSGTAVQTAGVAVTVSIPLANATLGGGAFTVNTDVTGLASFAGLTMTGVPGGKILQFAATLNGVAASVTAPVAIIPGPVTQMVLTQQPSATAQSGIAFAQGPIVQLEDAVGNAAPVGQITISVTIATGGGALSGPLGVFTTASGVASFTGISISGAAGTRTLRFSAVVDGTALTVVSAPIVVGP